MVVRETSVTVSRDLVEVPASTFSGLRLSAEIRRKRAENRIPLKVKAAASSGSSIHEITQCMSLIRGRANLSSRWYNRSAVRPRSPHNAGHRPIRWPHPMFLYRESSATAHATSAGNGNGFQHPWTVAHLHLPLTAYIPDFKYFSPALYVSSRSACGKRPQALGTLPAPIAPKREHLNAKHAVATFKKGPLPHSRMGQ